MSTRPVGPGTWLLRGLLVAIPIAVIAVWVWHLPGGPAEAAQAAVPEMVGRIARLCMKLLGILGLGAVAAYRVAVRRS